MSYFLFENIIYLFQFFGIHSKAIYGQYCMLKFNIFILRKKIILISVKKPQREHVHCLLDQSKGTHSWESVQAVEYPQTKCIALITYRINMINQTAAYSVYHIISGHCLIVTPYMGLNQLQWWPFLVSCRWNPDQETENLSVHILHPITHLSLLFDPQQHTQTHAWADKRVHKHTSNSFTCI